jgi:hypothetical protein
MSEISSDNPLEWLAMTLTALGAFGFLCLIIYLLNRRKGKFKLADIWRIMSDWFHPCFVNNLVVGDHTHFFTLRNLGFFSSQTITKQSKNSNTQ